MKPFFSMLAGNRSIVIGRPRMCVNGATGSAFVLTLPLPASVVVEPRPAPRSEQQNGARRVVVVDDNRDAAESLADLVRMLGHGADLAYDGPTAIEKVRADRRTSP